MELVVDANVIVAGFLREAITRKLILDERLKLWTPEYSLMEAEHVLSSPRVRKRLGGLSDTEIRLLLTTLTARIEILHHAIYKHKLAQAKTIAPHPEDAPYLAMALHLGIGLWSNDLALKNQSLIQVHTTQELIALFYRRT